jgi:hypothetical protein
LDRKQKVTKRGERACVWGRGGEREKERERERERKNHFTL